MAPKGNKDGASHRRAFLARANHLPPPRAFGDDQVRLPRVAAARIELCPRFRIKAADHAQAGTAPDERPAVFSAQRARHFRHQTSTRSMPPPLARWAQQFWPWPNANCCALWKKVLALPQVFLMSNTAPRGPNWLPPKTALFGQKQTCY